MNTLLQDLRYALRQLRKSPGFTFTAVAVLALGLGANIAVFTVLNGILLRPLPYARPDRVVEIKGAGTEPYYMMSYANMLQLRDAVGARMRIGAVMNRSMASIVGPGGRFQAQKIEVTAGLPDLLGAQPILGRSFRDEENDPGRNRVVLIGEEVWRRFYASDPQIVGKTLSIKSQPYTILGVMPKGFSFPFHEDMQIWSPAAIDPASRSSMSDEKAAWGELYARLPEGMTVAQLTDQLSRAQASIAKEVPSDAPVCRPAHRGHRISAVTESEGPQAAPAALCRGSRHLGAGLPQRHQPDAGARRFAHARAGGARRSGRKPRASAATSVVESLLLSSIGSVFGLLLGQSAIKLLWHQISRNLPLTSAVHLDWRVMACLAALTLFTALLVGVFPALRAMRRNVQASLHGVTATASASQNRTREALVVAQLALTLVFLAGAGLFLRTIHALRSVPLGFTQQNVLTGGIILNAGSHQLEEGEGKPQDASIVRTAYLPLLDRLRAIPGVQVAALSSVLPLRAEFGVTIAGNIDHKEVPRSQAPSADGRLASPGLVDALGIPMLRGRFFTEDDTASAPPVVVVSIKPLPTSICPARTQSVTFLLWAKAGLPRRASWA